MPVRRARLPFLILAVLLTQSVSAGEVPVDPALAAPMLTCDDGVVAITCATPRALILFSIDGSDPSATAAPYLAPISLSHGGTVKARAFAPDRSSRSALAEATYPALRPDEPKPPSTLVPVTQGRDWPGYDWAKRHAGVKANVIATRPKLVFIGDSISHFFGGEPSDRGGAGAEVWKAFYEPRGVANLGFGWDRTENVLWRLNVDDELGEVSPAVAVVMIGTNNLHINSVEEISLGIARICGVLNQRHPTTRVLLLGIFPRGEKPGPDRDKIAQINARIATLDGRDGITYLDIGAAFIGVDGIIPRDVMGDGLHPSAKGYRLWAEAMEPTLAKLLGDAKP